jgi:hypothetical protein
MGDVGSNMAIGRIVGARGFDKNFARLSYRLRVDLGGSSVLGSRTNRSFGGALVFGLCPKTFPRLC